MYITLKDYKPHKQILIKLQPSFSKKLLKTQFYKTKTKISLSKIVLVQFIPQIFIILKNERSITQPYSYMFFCSKQLNKRLLQNI